LLRKNFQGVAIWWASGEVCQWPTLYRVKGGEFKLWPTPNKPGWGIEHCRLPKMHVYLDAKDLINVIEVQPC